MPGGRRSHRLRRAGAALVSAGLDGPPALCGLGIAHCASANCRPQSQPAAGRNKPIRASACPISCEPPPCPGSAASRRPRSLPARARIGARFTVSALFGLIPAAPRSGSRSAMRCAGSAAGVVLPVSSISIGRQHGANRHRRAIAGPVSFGRRDRDRRRPRGGEFSRAAPADGLVPAVEPARIAGAAPIAAASGADRRLRCRRGAGRARRCPTDRRRLYRCFGAGRRCGGVGGSRLPGL